MSQALIPSYAGKKVVVSGGGGRGMGAAAVAALLENGAEVWVLDVQEPQHEGTQFLQVDLKDPKAIENAIEQVGAGIDALFNCVGVAGNRTSDLDTFLINFAGVRHLTNTALKYINDDGAIATIASNAGEKWRNNLREYEELIAQDSFDGAIEWFNANEHLREPGVATAAYRVSKQAIAAWGVLSSAQRGEDGKRRIRQNTVMPGFTETPMGAEFRNVLSDAYFDSYPTPLGRYLDPSEPAKALLFLNSDLASGVNGVTLTVDGGATAALEATARV
ncbi:3-alpha-hydroxysteroid dehydrogenase [Corynebacterium suranareeae]|uniref:3-alpha-hydroxysteroid dehydrogenase n=1 Tax=Corynebacterium suranareeae TaxID=2506452 RepID=A0A160PNK4_9CORY|nr:SDR family oxidoreductase [Corynebacterium suranareeae]BAU94413.1 3-alpha-hydroxysteroid dehydrogenase [Corynebacterium suranareeae]